MYILFDIGGTKMRVGISEGGRHLGAHKIVKTPSDFQEGMNVLSSLVSELTEGQKVKAAAGGLAGTLYKGTLVRSPHLKGWEGKPAEEEIKKAIGAQVYLENDAAIVGLGEALFGAGRGYKIVAYLTISTGVGGVRIVDGSIDPTTSNFEPGHHIIDFSGAVLPRDNPCGTLEDFISGSSLKRRFNINPENVTEEGVWEELSERLAYGLYNTIMYWSPEVIVLGGPMIVGHPGIDLHRTTQYLKELLETFPYIPVIKKGELGAIGGLYGALGYLK